jgi:hypothetical protein
MNIIDRIKSEGLNGAAFLIVTRHQALVAHIQSLLGAAASKVAVLDHATAEDVRGRHVLGVLPLALAACAASVTDFPLTTSRDQRGVEQDAPTYGDPVTYTVLVSGP